MTAALGRALRTAAGAGELLLRPAALLSRSQGLLIWPLAQGAYPQRRLDGERPR